MSLTLYFSYSTHTNIYILKIVFTIVKTKQSVNFFMATTQLNGLPRKILRSWLRKNHFDYKICHVTSKDLYTADAFSCAPTIDPSKNSIAFLDELELYEEALTGQHSSWSTRNNRSLIWSLIRSYCAGGWPAKSNITTRNRPYSRSWSQNAVQQPNGAVWWPEQISMYSSIVSVCETIQLTLISTLLHNNPWKIMGSDLFHHHIRSDSLELTIYQRFQMTNHFGRWSIGIGQNSLNI